MNGKPREPLILVGLGNPGSQYTMTRHNLGWRVASAFADKYGFPFKEDKKFNAHVAKGVVGDTTVYILLPTTYMNLSGQSVSAFLNFYKLPQEDALILVDDSALDFGQMRVRTSGSAGGHNGLKSIEQHLGGQHYPRLRLGIGQQSRERDLSDHVLGRFTSEEQTLLPKLEERAIEAIELLLKKDIEHVMNQVNPQPKGQRETEEKKNEV